MGERKLRFRRATYSIALLGVLVCSFLFFSLWVIYEDAIYVLNPLLRVIQIYWVWLAGFLKGFTLKKIWMFAVSLLPGRLKVLIIEGFKRGILLGVAYALGARNRARVRRLLRRGKARVRHTVSRSRAAVRRFGRPAEAAVSLSLTIISGMAIFAVTGVVAFWWFGGVALLLYVGRILLLLPTWALKAVWRLVRLVPGMDWVGQFVVRLVGNIAFKKAVLAWMSHMANALWRRFPIEWRVAWRRARLQLHRAGIKTGKKIRSRFIPESGTL